jgi:sterol desaturase/sphingolipid hydroxylase (fatty acid hydroxylase superfamily)
MMGLSAALLEAAISCTRATFPAEYPGVVSLVFLYQTVFFSLVAVVGTAAAVLIGAAFPPLYRDKRVVGSANRSLDAEMVLNNVLQWVSVGFASTILAYYLLYWKPDHMFLYYFPDPSPLLLWLPSELVVVLCRVVANVHTYDFCIYWYHRGAHVLRGTWLHRSHKMHHLNNKPCSFWHSIYGDLIEGFAIGVFAHGTVMGWPISAPAALLFYSYIGLFVSLNHIGRDINIPFLYSSRFHQNHHIFRNCNFCEHTPVWDCLFGTYRASGVAYVY